MAWSLVSDYTPTGGPIATAASPGSIGNGFVDYGGSQWAVDASNNLITTSSSTNQRPYTTNLLVRNNAFELVADSKWTVRFTNQVQSNSSLEFYFRIINLGATQSSYTFASASGLYMGINTTIAGGYPNSIAGAVTTGSFTLTAGTQYDLTMSCVQTNATTTTLQTTLFSTTGTQLGQITATDTTASLQNVAGYSGLAVNNNTGSPKYTFQRIRAYSDSVSTSYSVAIAPASILAGSSAVVSVSVIGGSSLLSPLSVTLSDAASGNFSPNPVVINSGSTVGNSTYTPSGANVPRTVSYAYTGGNAGMTGNGSSVVAVYTVTLMTDTSVVLSPYNWRVGAAGANSYQAWNTGSYARVYVTGSTSIIIYTDTNSTFGSYAYSVDNGVLSTLATIPSSGQISITLPDSSAHYVTLILADSQRTGTGSYRWGGTSYLGIKSYSLGFAGTPNSTAAIAAKGSKNILIFGDDMTDGQQAQDGTSNILYDYSYYLGESLRQQGFEYGIVGAAGVGFAVTGAGGVPPVYTPGNAAQTSYDKVDSTNSRLVAGKFSPSPDIIYFNLGANDSLYSGSAANLSAWLTALRSAAPSALIFVGIPFAGYYRSSITTQFNSYQNATPDPNTQIIDLNIDSRITNLAYTQGDNIHPNAWGHANIASLLIAKLSLAYTKATTPKTGKTGLFRR